MSRLLFGVGARGPLIVDLQQALMRKRLDSRAADGQYGEIDPFKVEREAHPDRGEPQRRGCRRIFEYRHDRLIQRDMPTIFIQANEGSSDIGSSIDQPYGIVPVRKSRRKDAHP